MGGFSQRLRATFKSFELPEGRTPERSKKRLERNYEIRFSALARKPSRQGHQRALIGTEMALIGQ